MLYLKSNQRLRSLLANLILRSLFLGLAGEIFNANPIQAQIIPDNTLGNERSHLTPNNVIEGGATRGPNLFHSFSEFNVGEGQQVNFANPNGIQRIISRITGKNRSQILGTLGVLGNADLFFINPNGIIFGANARLDVRGSFVASTADSILFDSGFAFSASNPQAPPLLTVNVPVGLQFGANPGNLINRSITSDTDGNLVGLQVPLGKTLALVGGDIALEGGWLRAESGRIELGSVAGSSRVNLTPIVNGWALDYTGVQNFQDISLSQAARATISGNGGNSIQVQGRRVTLSGGAQLDANTIGDAPGGNLTVNASESVNLTGRSEASGNPSGLIARTGGAGNSGNIAIATQQLSITDRATIATDTFNAGNAGNISVFASESVEVSGSDNSTGSGLAADARVDSTGNAGNISITTGRLIVSDGGQIGASSFASGKGGDLTIIASDSVEVSGVNPTDEFSSNLATQSDQTSTGASGNLRIETRRLTIRDGAFVSASNRGLGRGGKLEIVATESVTVAGVSFLVDYPTYLQNDGLGRGGAGDLLITTPLLLVNDRARISASSISGEGGNIIINAGSVILRNGGVIESDADPSANAFPKPDITIDSTANGGNTIINADNLLILENSAITANAVKGQGGNLLITLQGVFLRSSESTISTSSQLGVNGLIDIQTPDIDPSQGLVILSTDLVDPVGLIAQRCPSNASETGSFVNTGRGGVPTNPTAPLIADTLWQDLELLGETGKEAREQRTTNYQRLRTDNPTSPIVEAQGWVVLSNGAIVLTAQAPTVTPYRVEGQGGLFCR
ncbi:filamentous hemagglutinin N-terminal domain-containing protein [Phormidium sp. LEGE 05292]|uniref:two-partner secretion domain-containing protein n=1 Tax=[Phormidium] sp. LEGE 05292 TaxID=767427 RepID=UPI0018804CA2|nr:filamentous hemagglutinin N-terminal domain-containing protein [Phormidium sp. LEGE 05292]MBE9228797.1 filamentous hemagglutinin N-terminal domain-containing protein [Phormidium sp. LEGE 05292]